MSKPLPKELADQAVARVRAGESRAAVAKSLGISTDTVKRRAKAAGLPSGPCGTRHTLAVADYFARIDTPDRAYWLGFAAADASVEVPGPRRKRDGTMSRSYRYRIGINLKADDAGHLAAFLAAVGSTSPVTRRWRCDKRTRKWYESARIAIHSKQMAVDLISHGVTPDKTDCLRPWVGDPSLLPHYWRGFTDGDGTISKDHKCVGVVGTLEMAAGFSWFATSLGLPWAVPYKHPSKPVWMSCYTRLEYIVPLLKALYPGTDGLPVLARKAKAAAATLAWVSRPDRKQRNDWAGVTAADIEGLLAKLGGWTAVGAHFGITAAGIARVYKKIQKGVTRKRVRLRTVYISDREAALAEERRLLTEARGRAPEPAVAVDAAVQEIPEKAAPGANTRLVQASLFPDSPGSHHHEGGLDMAMQDRPATAAGGTGGDAGQAEKAAASAATGGGKPLEKDKARVEDDAPPAAKAPVAPAPPEPDAPLQATFKAVQATLVPGGPETQKLPDLPAWVLRLMPGTWVRFPSLWVGEVIIHPWAAAVLLEKHNKRNRPLGTRWAAIAEQLKSNCWMLTGETMVFDTDDDAQSAQHRLKACAESGVPVHTLAVWGVSPEVMRVIDSGTHKKITDRFAMRGEKNVATLAATLSIVHQFLKAGTVARHVQGGSKKITYIHSEELLDLHPGIRDSIKFAVGKDRIGIKSLGGASFAAALHWALSRPSEAHASAASELIECVCACGTLPHWQDVNVLTKRLQAFAAEKVAPATRAIYVIKAFNAHMEGRVTAKLSWDVNKEGYPQIHGLKYENKRPLVGGVLYNPDLAARVEADTVEGDGEDGDV